MFVYLRCVDFCWRNQVVGCSYGDDGSVHRLRRSHSLRILKLSNVSHHILRKFSEKTNQTNLIQIQLLIKTQKIIQERVVDFYADFLHENGEVREEIYRLILNRFDHTQVKEWKFRITTIYITQEHRVSSVH
jgi:hypothetical protein